VPTFGKLPELLYFNGVVTPHPTSSAQASGERVEKGSPGLSAATYLAGTVEACCTAAVVQISTGTVTRMPKWVVYCGQCNRPSTYNEIDVSTIDLAAPTAKKPVLPRKGERWECPLCKRESQIRDCDLTYSYA
jgi:hypothetical protein